MGRRQVFGLTGVPIYPTTGFLPAIASHSYPEQCLMMAIVPEYRYGLAPDSDRVPSYDAPQKGANQQQHSIYCRAIYASILNIEILDFLIGFLNNIPLLYSELLY